MTPKHADGLAKKAKGNPATERQSMQQRSIDLERRLDEALQTISALLAGQIDAVVDTQATSVLLLQRAQESAMRLASIVESSQEAIISCAMTGEVTTWNAAAVRLFGYSAGEAVGKRVEELIPAVVAVAASAAGGAAIADLSAATPDDRQIESVRRCKHGGTIAVSMSVSLVTDLGGSVICRSIIARDITQRIVDGEERMLRQKLEAIGRLAAGVAHEINTPIQFIGDNLHFLAATFAKLLADQRELAAASTGSHELAYLATEIPNAIQESLEGVRRVAGIIRGLKEFSHPGTAEAKPFDLNAAITSTIALSRNEHRDVADIRTDLATDLPEIVGRITEIQQVILILIVNAAHAIGARCGSGTRQDAGSDRMDAAVRSAADDDAPGAPAVFKGDGPTADATPAQATERGVISISTRRDADHVQLTVSDSGPGVPEHLRARLFEPFFTTKPVGAGTGQGLYIAHDIVVNRHHGSIAYEPGAGATFVIELPIRPTVVVGS